LLDRRLKGTADGTGGRDIEGELENVRVVVGKVRKIAGVPGRRDEPMRGFASDVLCECFAYATRASGDEPSGICRKLVWLCVGCKHLVFYVGGECFFRVVVSTGWC